MDYGHKLTDEELKELEKRINAEYTQAEKEVAQKLSNYLAGFMRRDIEQKTLVDAGEISEREYLNWRAGQIATGKRWEELRQSLAEDMHRTNVEAQKQAQSESMDIYALNHNYGTYEVENDAEIDTKYTLYDRQTVERLVKDNPQMLPPPGKKVSERIKAGLDVRWNNQHIQSVMMQSLLQGESVGKIATRLANAVGDSNRAAAIRNARTMTTGAENAGRVDAYERAKEMGVPVRQMWVATLDERTRESHRKMDGETIEPGETFSNKCRFPGDPLGEPSEVYNCRCTLVARIPGVQYTFAERGTDKASYEEWKKGKEEQASKSEPIDVKPVYGNALDIISNQKDIVDGYAERINPDDLSKFNKIFADAEYKSGNSGNYYNPSDNSVMIDAENINGTTLFHESTHWFDYNQNYIIEDDWGHYVRKYDDDGNLISKVWESNIVIQDEHASFSAYILHKWDRYERGEEFTPAQKDLANFVKLVGTSDTYGYDRKPSDVENDVNAIKSYMQSKGISTTDADYVHLSDFVSALSYDANLGSFGYGGHDYSYWVNHNENRVAEITAGYNLLRATGREDMLDVERELAPNLMAMIEDEWSKIW